MTPKNVNYIELN